MKKFILVLMLIVFALSGCSSSAPDTESDSVGETDKSTQSDSIQLTQQKYKDITFNIPSDWEIKDIDNGNFYAYANEDDFLTLFEKEMDVQLNDFFFNIYVSALGVPDNISKFEILSKQSKTINNKVYFIADIKCLDNGKPMYYQHILVEHNLTLYTFIMSCTRDSFLYADEMNMILSSLKFEAPTNSPSKSIETKTITYEDATFDIPATWKDVSEITNNVCFQIKDIDNLMVDKIELEIPFDEDLFDMYLNVYAESDNCSNFSVVHKESKTINNKVYFIAKTNFLRDGYFTSMQLCVTEHKGFLYSFVITARGDGDDLLYADELNKLLNSIKFTDNKITSTDKPKTNNSSITNSHTLGEQNALKEAISYLGVSAFSKQGLIEQLEYEGYSLAEATYAVENCGANWNAQAAKSAKQYLDIMSFSRSGLIDQLLHEGFTQEEAAYGVKAVGY